jgi:hypothetical protein
MLARQGIPANSPETNFILLVNTRSDIHQLTIQQRSTRPHEPSETFFEFKQTEVSKGGHAFAAEPVNSVPFFEFLVGNKSQDWERMWSECELSGSAFFFSFLTVTSAN